MQLSFLGGASTVTGSRFLLTTERARVLVDCGMFQGSPNETIRNRVPLGFEPSEVDAILITHAHLDHCGLLPVVVREGFKGPIYLTSATAELVELVLLDSGRLQQEFAKRHSRWERRHEDEAVDHDEKSAAKYRAALDELARAEAEGHVPTTVEPVDGDRVAGTGPPDATPSSEEGVIEAAADMDDPEVALREQPAEIVTDLDAPLYTEDDAKVVLPMFQAVRYGREVEVAPGVVATFVDAGHILGSAIIRLDIRETDGAEPTTIVFSGDLGRPNTPIIRDPTTMTEADFVVVESTYGGREHEPSEEAVRLLAEIIHAVSDAGGVLLMPSFAIGRTQRSSGSSTA